MNKTKIFSQILISLFTIILTQFLVAHSFADESTKNRIRECTIVNNKSIPEGLEWDPTGGSKDFMYEVDNPICLAVVLPPYATVKAAIASMNSICGSGSAIPRVLPTPSLDLIDIAKAGRKALSNGGCGDAITVAVASLSTFLATISVQYGTAKDVYENTSLCGGGLEDNWTRWNSTTMLRDIDDKKATVENVVKEWITNCQSDSTSTDCQKLKDGLSNKNYRQYYYGGVEYEDNSENACPDTTRTYGDYDDDNNKITLNGTDYPAQRYYMRGTEAANYACERFNKKNQQDKQDDYDIAYQCCVNKSKKTACIERKLCRSGGFTSACVASDIATVYKFCDAGSRCTLEYGSNLECEVECNTTINKNLETSSQNKKIDIGYEYDNIGYEFTINSSWYSWYKAITVTCKKPTCNFSELGYRSTINAEYNVAFEDNKRMICVSTYNMCPYNFNIGGGSTKCNYFKDGEGTTFKAVSPEDVAANDCQGKSDIRDDDCTLNENAGKCENYCQYLNHCVIVGGNNYKYDSTISSPYFSTACLDFAGDSKNNYGYETGIIAGSQKHFTAPIAQCVRETLENIFQNKAGHTKCANYNQYPDEDGICADGSYEYQKGENVSGTTSFFSFLQKNITNIIKLILTVSVMLQGMKIMLTGEIIKIPELIKYAIKIGLVLFFVISNAWQDFFFDGIYNTSATFSEIVMNIKTSTDPTFRDGCQFGTISFADGSSSVVSSYPSGKEYLAVFDTFDCKIARYLGFGPKATVANIAKLIFAAFFTGPIGIYFAVLTIIFGIFMIVIALSALHIFLASALAIILMVYVSPITIVCALFKKTEGIFNRWLAQLIGFSLQPIILFAYIGFFVTIFETLVSGSAKFSGNAPTKEIICDKSCVASDGSTAEYTISDTGKTVGATKNTDDCDDTKGEEILDPMSDSVACIMNLENDEFGKIPVLEPLGIALPILNDLFTENGREKILTMTRAVLIIYILSSFMNEIPGIASNIMGGSTMPGAKFSPENIAKNLTGAMLAIQKRGVGATGKVSSASIKGTKEITKALGNRKKRASTMGSSGE